MCIVVFLIMFISTRPNIILTIGATDLIAKKAKLIDEDQQLLKKWHDFTVSMLLYVAISFFILGTFSFEENMFGIPIVFAGIIILMLMDKKWNWSTRIAKPCLYLYVVCVIAFQVCSAIPTSVFTKTIGFDPVAYFEIPESQKTLSEIDKTKLTIADKKKDLQLQAIQEDLDNCLKNAKTVQALNRCEEIGNNLEKFRETSMREDLVNAASNSANSASSKWHKFWQSEPEPSTTGDIIQPEPLGYNDDGGTNKTKIYYPSGSPYTITLKAGETTNYWIIFPTDRKYAFNLSSDDYKYIVTFDDGTSYNCWEISKFPHKEKAKFTITAVTDQQINLNVS